MEQRLTIVTLGVRNLKVSSAFYENCFGWKRTAASNENITFYHLNGMELALYGRDELAHDAMVGTEGSGFRSFTLAHNVRSEKEVDDLFGNLAKKGVSVVKKAAKTFWGGYSGYISDPDGNLWEIAYNPYLELDKNGNTLPG